MKKNVKIPRTRRLVQTKEQLKDLLMELYVPESVPNKITSFYVHKEKLVTLGTIHNKPVRLETHRGLLTTSARSMKLLSSSEDIIEFAREGDNIVFLVTATDIEGNPLEYTRGPIKIHRADVKAYLKNNKPPSNLTAPNKKDQMMWGAFYLALIAFLFSIFTLISATF